MRNTCRRCASGWCRTCGEVVFWGARLSCCRSIFNQLIPSSVRAKQRPRTNELETLILPAASPPTLIASGARLLTLSEIFRVSPASPLPRKMIHGIVNDNTSGSPLPNVIRKDWNEKGAAFRRASLLITQNFPTFLLSNAGRGSPRECWGGW